MAVPLVWLLLLVRDVLQAAANIVGDRFSFWQCVVHVEHGDEVGVLVWQQLVGRIEKGIFFRGVRFARVCLLLTAVFEVVSEGGGTGCEDLVFVGELEGFYFGADCVVGLGLVLD